MVTAFSKIKIISSFNELTNRQASTRIDGSLTALLHMLCNGQAESRIRIPTAARLAEQAGDRSNSDLSR